MTAEPPGPQAPAGDTSPPAEGAIRRTRPAHLDDPVPPIAPGAGYGAGPGAGDDRGQGGVVQAGGGGGQGGVAVQSGGGQGGHDLRPRTVRGPFSGFILAVAVTGAVVAAVWALLTNRQVPVLVATSDLPAFQEVTLDDLRMDTRTALKDDDTYAGVPVEGRITLKAIKKGEPLTNADLSPDVRRVLKGDLTVVGLDVSRGNVLGGALRSGDPIQVLPLGKGEPAEELRAVVLSATSGEPAKGRWSLVVAMNDGDAREHAATLAGDRVLILRDPRAGRP